MRINGIFSDAYRHHNNRKQNRRKGADLRPAELDGKSCAEKTDIVDISDAGLELAQLEFKQVMLNR